MSLNSHTVLSEIECPLCQTVNQFETVSSGSMKESESDTDFSQKEIHWVDSSLDMIHPLLYYVAVCQNCNFAVEITDSYKNWQGHPSLIQKIKSIKSSHLEKLSQNNSSIKKLGEAINVEQYPNQSAIIKIHLAIIDELLDENQDPLQLGRYYLRIGWLYRFINSTENEKSANLENKLSEIDNSYSEFKNQITNSKSDFDNLNHKIQNHLNSDDITGKFNSGKELQNDEIAGSIEDLASQFEQFQYSLSDFEEKLDDYKNGILKRSSEKLFDKSISDTDFRDFLFQVKSVENCIVLDEPESLSNAIKYFEDALNISLTSLGQRRLQVLYLTGELSRRIDDHESAIKYFNMTITEGQKLINENINDQPRVALPKKILELAIEQMQFCNEITTKYKAEVL
jgi:uncharacterized protein (DUF2225 family)